MTVHNLNLSPMHYVYVPNAWFSLIRKIFYSVIIMETLNQKLYITKFISNCRMAPLHIWSYEANVDNRQYYKETQLPELQKCSLGCSSRSNAYAGDIMLDILFTTH